MNRDVYMNDLMTEAIAFDTHRFVKRLTKNGFSEQQAETLAEEQVALINSNLATKTDVEALRQATKSDIERSKSELIKWVFAALIAQGGLIVALGKVL